ncbi:hypothetical protein N9N28_06345 [Rubripirellula amarantea]|nr:hypothetical protein [Rubripirellula amarantea]
MFHAHRFTAHHFVAWSLPIVAILSCTLAKADDGTLLQPYSVFVSQAASFARSGPRTEDYRTDPLRHGQQLEVYAETQDGWLGIRPPEGSFSWIPAEAVEVDGSGDQGTVVEDASIVWIGTQLGQARKYGWQVRLYEGEPVTIIGRSERDGPDGPQLWYRIVPPSGEFRFVHRSEIVRTAEDLVASIKPVSMAESGRNIPAGPTGPTHIPNQPSKEFETVAASTSAKSRQRIEADARAVPDSTVVANAGSSVLDSDLVQQASHVDDWQSNVNRSGNAQPLPPTLAQAGVAPKSTPGSAEETNPRPRGLLASVAMLGRPKIREIGAADTPEAVNDDKSWVAGLTRRLSPSAETPSVPMTQPFQQSYVDEAQVAQVSGIAPLPAQELYPARDPLPATTASTPLSNISSPPRLSPIGNQPVLRTAPSVSPARVTELQRQVQGADLATMQVLLSQLMASQGSAAEARIIFETASSLASRSADATTIHQAQTLASRASDYAHLAMRRDGNGGVQQLDAPVFPTSPSSAPSMLPVSDVATSTLPSESGPQLESISGQLVQVYSARPQSPPFALTDGTGRTVAYVTPSPGINLRMHLNSQVTVTGEKGFVNGVNLPHVFAEKAERVASSGLQFR